MNYADIFLAVLELAAAMGLYGLAGYAREVINTKWRICYVIPAIVCMVFTAFSGFEISMLGVHFGSVILLVGFVKDAVEPRRYSCIAAGACVIISVVVCSVNPGYRAPDYVADFKEGFETMRKHYILAQYKEIDWDSLYEEYLPQFEAADKDHDEVENALCWQSFCQEFHDGHVSYGTGKDTSRRANERFWGNDYGLSLMILESGQTVAVNVEEGSQIAEAGIRNGTVITAWDGKSIEEAKAYRETPFSGYASKENELFYQALPVAGSGGECVAITYLDENGQEQTVTAKRIGTYADRLQDTFDILNQGVEAGNLSWSNLSDKTVCLRIKTMMYDRDSYDNGDHSRMKEELQSRLLAFRQEGVTGLVLDLRSNAGGSAQFIMAIAELLAPEGKHVYAYDGVWDKDAKEYKLNPDTGNYEVGNGLTYEGENLWKGGRIVVLVNSETISAGDHLTQILSGYDNVTVMGFTPSNGSGQGVRGITFSDGQLTYSAVPVLNEDGTIFVDSDASRVSQIMLDEKIPFNKNTVRALFDEGRDYMLEYAAEYLEKDGK